MEFIGRLFDYVFNLGLVVAIPFIFLVLALIMRVPLLRALYAALVTGFGFAGIFLVVDLLLQTLGSVVQGIIANFSLTSLNVVDIGWPVIATVALTNTQIVPWVFLLGIVLNLALLAVGFTRTINVDMWNYWHLMFAGSIVSVVTSSPALGIFAALIMLVLLLLLADWTAPVVQEYFGLPSVSFAHGNTVVWAPLGWAINRVIDRIPGVRNWTATPKMIRQRFGVFGEPMFIVIGLGSVLSTLAFFPALRDDFGSGLARTLQSTMALGAVVFIMPRMVAILMEGLYPFAEGVRTYMTHRFPGQQVHIGIDAAAAIGNEAVLATGIVLVPITLLLAVVLAGLGLNRMLPFTDLVSLPFYAIWAVPWSKGNIVRSLITGTIFSAMMLIIASNLAPITTQIALSSDPVRISAALETTGISIPPAPAPAEVNTAALPALLEQAGVALRPDGDPLAIYDALRSAGLLESPPLPDDLAAQRQADRERISNALLSEGNLQMSAVSVGSELLAWALSLPFRIFGGEGMGPLLGLVLLLAISSVGILMLKGAIDRRDRSKPE